MPASQGLELETGRPPEGKKRDNVLALILYRNPD